MKCFELEDRMIDIGKNVAVKLQIGYMVRQMEALFPSVMTEFKSAVSTVSCICC